MAKCRKVNDCIHISETALEPKNIASIRQLEEDDLSNTEELDIAGFWNDSLENTSLPEYSADLEPGKWGFRETLSLMNRTFPGKGGKLQTLRNEKGETI